MNKLSLSQLDYLINGILDDQYFKENYDLNYSDLYDKLEKITDKQKSYLWACMYRKRYSGLNDVLRTLGVYKKQKNVPCNGCAEDHEPEDCITGFNSKEI